MKSRIVIAGGSGFIGQSLSRALLLRDQEIVILTRSPSDKASGLQWVQWDGKTIGDWAQFLEGATAVVNLTGKNISCRHTPANKREIIESRINSVQVLGQAIAGCAQPPGSFVQASAVGIYGNAGARWCEESAPPGDDFIAQVCRQWEGAFRAVVAPITKKALLRVGITLGSNGGFLPVLNRLTRSFLGGHVGSGRQYISWIHLADLTRMFLWAIERPEVAGVFNATAPHPATNTELMRELRRAWHRPWSPPVPKWAAHIGSWLMGTEASLAFSSQRCTPKHFLEQGFEFEFPEIRPALVSIVPNS